MKQSVKKLFASYHASKISFSASYVAEMVRQELYKRYGEDAYTDSYIYTTIVRKDHIAAVNALHDNLINYDMCRWLSRSRKNSLEPATNTVVT